MNPCHCHVQHFKTPEVLRLKYMPADDNQYLHQQLIKLSRDRIIGAAKLLNVRPSTLRGKMKRLDIPYGRKTAL